MKIYLLSVLLLFSSLVKSEEITKPCSDKDSTVEIDECLQKEILSSQNQLQAYLSTVLNQQKDNPKLLAIINESQASWYQYYQSQCRAVYEYWQAGTIRSIASAHCKIKLLKTRTNELLHDFLTN